MFPLMRRMLLLFVIALALRAIYLIEIAGTPLSACLLGDGIAYDAWARRIAAGDWLGSEVFYQAPFYPYALGILYALFGADLLWARTAQALFGAVSCVVVASAGTRFFGPREGLAAGFLLAIYPPAIFFDGEIQKASFDLFFSAILLLLFAHLRTRSSAWMALASGITVGLFALNRENALLLLPLLALWLVFLSDAPLRRRVVVAMVFVAGAFAALLPVALRNRAIGGELLLTTSQLGTNFYIGNHPGADGRYLPLRTGRGSALYEREDATALAEEATGRALSPAEVSDYWLGRALAFVREEPGQWIALIARKWLLVWNRREIVDTTSVETAADYSRLLGVLTRVFHFGVLCPLALAGLWLSRRRWRELTVLYLLLVGWSVSVTAFFVLARYRYPLVPILALFAGVAFTAFVNAARRRDFASVVPATVLALFAAVFVNWPLDDRDPRAPTYANLGNAMADAGKIDDGKGMLERAVALSPRFAEAHLALGHLRYQSGDVDGAEASYRQAIDLQLPSAAAWNNLGMIAANRGRRDEAMEMFQRAIDIDDRHVPSMHNLARLRFEAGDHAAALDLYRRLAVIDDRDAEAQHQLANLYAFGGDFAAARQHYERAVAIDPARADAHFKLAVVLERLGENDAAQRHLARAIELVPAYAERYQRYRQGR
jgi:tetratricopeptide (TPR) repeat protein